MLSIAIKNSILVILIILILHFLLKSIIVERGGKVNPRQDKQELFDQSPKAVVMGQDPFEDSLTKADVCSNVRREDVQFKKQQQDELMRYVKMGDDDDKSLDMFFKDNQVSKDVKDIESKLESGVDICQLKTEDKQLPLSATCNANVQQMPTHDNRIKAECNLSQDKKNIMILTEYEDEKDMNGGALFGGLSAYDAFDLNYQTYHCKQKN